MAKLTSELARNSQAKLINSTSAGGCQMPSEVRKQGGRIFGFKHGRRGSGRSLGYDFRPRWRQVHTFYSFCCFCVPSEPATTGRSRGSCLTKIRFAQRSVTAYLSQTRTKCQRMRRSDIMCLVLWRILAYVLHATPRH